MTSRRSRSRRRTISAAHYPFGLLAVPREELVRVHASSGTHGQPTVVGYTRADLETWTELMARCMTMAGVRPGMVIHNANGYGLFTGGLGFHQGGERIGATVVPVSGGRTARQAMLVQDLAAEVLVSTPSYALAIAQALADAGAGETRLELGLFGGEPWTAQLRAEIERSLGLAAINFYGLSEMCGPGVAAECLVARHGLHVNEDHFIVEVIDPVDGRPLAPGRGGELVFTTLTKEALPLLRYRTRDIGSCSASRAECGRTTVRLTGPARPPRRHADRARRQHPPHPRRAAAAGRRGHSAALSPDRRARQAQLDELTLECEPVPDVIDREALRAQLARLLQEHTGLRITVSMVEPGTVPRSEGKAVRVVDRRG